MKKLLRSAAFLLLVFSCSFLVCKGQPFITADDTTTFCYGDSVHLCINPVYSSYLWNNGNTTRCITVTQSGSYFPWLIDSLGHIDTTLALNPLSVVVHHISVPLISQYSYLLRVTPTFTSYQWYINGQIYPGGIQQNICPFESGNYSVHVTDSNGCVGISNIIEFTIFGTNPNHVYIFCNYRTLTASSGYYNYQWYLNDTLIPGATSQTYQAVQSGTYQVEANFPNSCSITSPYFLFNNNSPCYAGIDDNNIIKNFTLSPNPFTQ